MRRDHIVSVRLTADELAALKEMGVPSDVLRELLREAIRPKAQACVVPVHGVSTTTGPSSVIWGDGSCGGQWPQPVSWVA